MIGQIIASAHFDKIFGTFRNQSDNIAEITANRSAPVPSDNDLNKSSIINLFSFIFRNSDYLNLAAKCRIEPMLFGINSTSLNPNFVFLYTLNRAFYDVSNGNEIR